MKLTFTTAHLSPEIPTDRIQVLQSKSKVFPFFSLDRPLESRPTVAAGNEPVYFAIIFILTLIIIVFVVYIVFKFNLRRRRHGKSFQGWIGEVGGRTGSDYERTDEDGQAMLLLLQQQQQQQQQQGTQPFNSPRSPFMKPPSVGHTGSRLNNYPLEQLRHYSKGGGSVNPVEKFQVISRLNNSNTNLVDHFLIRDTQQPLPEIPSSFNSLGRTSTNKYEEPNVFRNETKKLLGANSSATSTTTATITTTSGESENNESEPDYAEPIMAADSSRPPPVLPPPLPGSSPKCHSSSQNSATSDGSLDAATLCGKHEKFIKLSESICKYGYYSTMANLGVGVYITPRLLSSAYLDSDLYLRYGIDTSIRQTGYCALSPVVTVSVSRTMEELPRPIVLTFRHCISLGSTEPTSGLVVLWQGLDCPPSSDRWIEVVRYGEENLNTACYLQYDSQYAYLATNFLGRYVLCTRTSAGTEVKSGRKRIEGEVNKLVNFSLTTEPFSSTESLIKVFVYDNLPSSTLNLRNELPASGSGSSIQLRVGKGACEGFCSVLRVSPRAGALCFELQSTVDRKYPEQPSTQRVELPLAKLWTSGPNSLLHCSFVVPRALGDEEQTYQNERESYEVRVWQRNPLDVSKRATVVVLSEANTRRVSPLPGNTSHYYSEKCLHLFAEAELSLRSELIELLDRPRADQLDWRELASVSHFDHYLPYFASQASPTGQIMDLWEAKVFNELLRAEPDRLESPKDVFYSKLAHLLKNASRADLIDVIVSHQC